MMPLPTSAEEVEDNAVRAAVAELLLEKNGVKLTAFWQDILYIYVTRVEVVRSDEIVDLLKDAALPTWLRTMATGVGRASPSARFCVGLARGPDDSVVFEGPRMIRRSCKNQA